MSRPGRLRSLTGNWCFVGACLILSTAALASRRLTIDERALPVPGLHQVPLNLGPWTNMQEQQLEPEVIAALRPDDYILRDYTAQGVSAPISLFVAYFRSLQNDYGPHSPRICLPASGWMISSSKLTSIAVPGQVERVPVNQYTMQNGNSRILVLYWYQNNRRIWAEEYNAKLTFLPDLIRYRRSDASLVRLIEPIQEASPNSGEFADCQRFIELLFPHLVERLAVAG